MAADAQLTLNDYLAILRRRAPLMIATFLLVFAVAVVIAVALPPIYRSTGTILVESQQIPSELVQSTVKGRAEEQIQIIRQRIMTRDNLLRINERYRLYGDGGASWSPTEIVTALERNVDVELISARAGRRGGDIIAFKVSFEHRSPDIAYRVANELVTLFLAENAKVRSERASETTEFLAREAARLKGELEKLEQQLAQYKQQHADALPEHLQLRMAMHQRLEAQLASIERDLKANDEERSFLELELAAVNAGLRGQPAGAASGPAAELQQLRAQQAAWKNRYTPDHPDVKQLEARIAELEKELGAQSDANRAVAMTGSDLLRAQVQMKIDAVKERRAMLLKQQEAVRARLAEVEKQILQTPQVERAIYMLTRDHENARRKYDEVRAKQAQAEMAESLEEEQRAERFTLLEPPVRPDAPVRPNRHKLALVGFMAAVGSSGGLVFLLEVLNQRVRGAKALSAIIRQPPLVSIPYISTESERRRRRRKLITLIAVFSLLLIVGLAAVHFLYMPLDLLVYKIMARLG